MIAPRTNGTSAFGLFVQCRGEEGMNEDGMQHQQIHSSSNYNNSWSCNAVATFRLVSVKPGVEPYTKKICHTFHSKENDWGYKEFIDMAQLNDESKGFIHPNGAIRLEVEIQADAPHGSDWDSRKYTGYVGLRNQGATCYSKLL